MSSATHRSDKADAFSILVAEDNKLNVLLMAEQFRLLGVDAEIVPNGRVALERWRTGRFAAVLTDIQMPEMNGYQLAESIRREEGGKGRVPIIALTANASQDGSARCRKAGMDDCLEKPTELAILETMLQRWTRAPTAEACTSNEPVHAAAGLEQPVDPSKLSVLVGEDPAVTRDFLASFATYLTEVMGRIQSAMATQDLAAACSLAHQLKSSARAVGASRLAELANDMEGAVARPADCAAYEQLLGAEAVRVETWLTSSLADPQLPNFGPASP